MGVVYLTDQTSPVHRRVALFNLGAGFKPFFDAYLSLPGDTIQKVAGSEDGTHWDHALVEVD